MPRIEGYRESVELEDFRRFDFHSQFVFHIERGTRPGLQLHEKSEGWSLRELAIELMVHGGKHSKILLMQDRAEHDRAFKLLLETKLREVQNWYHGRNLPSPTSFRHLTRIQFSAENPGPWLDDTFRQAWLNARKAPTGRPEVIVYGRTIDGEEMMARVYAFDQLAYGYNAEGKPLDIDHEQFGQWWQAYPNGFLVALRKGEPFAVTGLFPVTRAWAEDFISCRVGEEDLTPDIIREARSDPANRTWYFSGISSTKEKNIRGHFPELIGMALLTWLRSHATTDERDPFLFVAEGTTDIGVRLLADHFRFSLESTGKGRQQAALSRGHDDRQGTAFASHQAALCPFGLSAQRAARRGLGGLNSFIMRGRALRRGARALSSFDLNQLAIPGA